MTRLPQLLFGRGAFAPVHHILEELSFEKIDVRPGGLPHSIFEELWHLDYWQRRFLVRARDEGSAAAHVEGSDWPPGPGPKDADEWRELLESIRLGLDEAAGMAADAEMMNRNLGAAGTLRGVLESLVAHNSYHLGRLVVLRQLLGMWPPHGVE